MRIDVRLNPNDLFNNEQYADAVNLDPVRSAQRFGKALHEQIEQRWPEADIEVFIDQGMAGDVRAWRNDEGSDVDQEVVDQVQRMIDSLNTRERRDEWFAKQLML